MIDGKHVQLPLSFPTAKWISPFIAWYIKEGGKKACQEFGGVTWGLKDFDTKINRIGNDRNNNARLLVSFPTELWILAFVGWYEEWGGLRLFQESSGVIGMVGRRDLYTLAVLTDPDNEPITRVKSLWHGIYNIPRPIGYDD